MNEPKRLYLDTEVVHPAGRRKVSIYRTSDTDVEYTRTDAFIEKACEYFAPHIKDNSGGYDRAFVLEGFKKYMGG